jgi:general secretion pathway protein L
LIAIECAFTRRVQLPLAALPHYKSAVALQLPKLLPMDPELLLTDVEILAVYPDSKRLDVELASVKRADLEPLIAAIQAWGLRVGSVHLAGAPGTAARFRFRAHHDHGLPLGLRRIDRWLMATAAGLTLSCVALAATESYRAAASLGQAQAATQDTARGALGQRQVLLARLEPLQALAQHENTPTAVAVLADVSALLPTDSWITMFEVKQRNLRLVGVSPDAASVVKLLAASRLLTDVELRSSTTAGIGTGKDRFEITAAIEPAIPVTPP